FKIAIVEKDTNFILNVFSNVEGLKIYEDKSVWMEEQQQKEIVGLTSSVELMVFPIYTYLEQETTLTEEAISQIMDKTEFVIKDPIDEIKELQQQNASLILDSMKKEGQISELKQQQATLIISLTEKGVL
ncbi:hypothetical protein COI89_21655, partial [Bacillus cereus]